MPDSRKNRRSFLRTSTCLAAGGAALGICPSLFAQDDVTKDGRICKDVVPKKLPANRTPAARAAIFTDTEFQSDVRARGQQAAVKAARAPTKGGKPARAPARAAALNSWEKDVLRVSFLGGDPATHREVERIVQEWSKYAQIDFDFGRHSKADIRVGFRDTGHWSYVGIESIYIRDQGEQTMNLHTDAARLDEFAYDRGVVLHEFGHALGLVHEHQNPGRTFKLRRDAVLSEFSGAPNNWDEATIIENVLKRYSENELKRFTEYDPKSIMAYYLPERLIESGEEIDINSRLSQTDVDFISDLYPGRSVDVVVNDDEMEGESNRVRRLLPDEDPIEAIISPRSPKLFFAVELDDKSRPWVFTQGYTQVHMSIRKNGGKKDLFAGGEWTSPDFVNIAQQIKFGKGKYLVEVHHANAGGTGEFKIGLASKRP